MHADLAISGRSYLNERKDGRTASYAVDYNGWDVGYAISDF
jgi:hypothetical protein